MNAKSTCTYKATGYKAFYNCWSYFPISYFMIVIIVWFVYNELLPDFIVCMIYVYGPLCPK